MKFYKCQICGNIVTLTEGDINRVTCCGKQLKELVPNTVDASTEKHIPVYIKENDKIVVKVGEVEHPMTEEHYIQFIAQEVDNNISITKLSSKDKPEAVFKYVKGSKIYEYCNLHGLWINTVE